MANEISTEQNVFSISGAKVAKVTTNTSDTYATATAMELPELQEMDVTITKETKEATYGAGKKADTFTILTGLDVKFTSVNIPLDVIAMINGSTIEKSGTTPNRKVVLKDNINQVPALFALSFKTDYVNGEPADFHETIHCVKGLLDVQTKADDYWTCSFEGSACERKKDHELRTIEGNETKADISFTEATTPEQSEGT